MVKVNFSLEGLAQRTVVSKFEDNPFWNQRSFDCLLSKENPCLMKWCATHKTKSFNSKGKGYIKDQRSYTKKVYKTLVWEHLFPYNNRLNARYFLLPLILLRSLSLNFNMEPYFYRCMYLALTFKKIGAQRSRLSWSHTANINLGHRIITLFTSKAL